MSKIQNFTYQNCAADVVFLPAGIYRLEVWGASGGNGKANGGLGGYSKGEITLDKKTRVFVHVGSQGTSTSGGCNGGGTSSHSKCAAGGGATDVRLFLDDLYARIIVAGGGGGGGSSASIEPGGAGGGLYGIDGKNSNEAGKGASQNSNTTTCKTTSYTTCGVGTFGQGGSKHSGGGGGWYGGSGSDCNDGGGGGSGYVLNSTSYKPSKYLITNSKYYLTNVRLLDGTKSFPSPTSTSNEVGHSGNGYARISFIRPSRNQGRYTYRMSLKSFCFLLITTLAISS